MSLLVEIFAAPTNKLIKDQSSERLGLFHLSVLLVVCEIEEQGIPPASAQVDRLPKEAEPYFFANDHAEFKSHLIQSLPRPPID